MKHVSRLLLCASLLSSPVFLRAVQPGDTRATVIAEMGNPTGEIAAGPLVVLVYARGEIRLRDGRVSTVNLLSDEELATQQTAEAAAKERAKIDRAARLARLDSEGRALRLAKKTDPDFASMSAVEQLSFWRNFSARYPMIAIESELEPLRARASEEERLLEITRANEERLASLEARLAETEDRAARAEREARQARNNSSSYNGWSPYSTGRPYTIRMNNETRPRHGERPRANENKPEAETTTPNTTSDDPRAKAMADYEEARRAAYRLANP